MQCEDLQILCLERCKGVQNLVESDLEKCAFTCKIGVDTGENEPSEILKSGCRPTTDKGHCMQLSFQNGVQKLRDGRNHLVRLAQVVGPRQTQFCARSQNINPSGTLTWNHHVLLNLQN